MESLKKYIHDNKNRFINELYELIRIPSISTGNEHKADMEITAELIQRHLQYINMNNIEIIQTEGNPLIYADKIINDDLPTILVYGHYDVMPPDPLDQWDSPPFEAEIRNENIYGRGTADDKGQIFIHIKALDYMIGNNQLPCNVKVLIEGEEEIGSPQVKNTAVIM